MDVVILVSTQLLEANPPQEPSSGPFRPLADASALGCNVGQGPHQPKKVLGRNRLTPTRGNEATTVYAQALVKHRIRQQPRNGRGKVVRRVGD